MVGSIGVGEPGYDGRGFTPPRSFFEWPLVPVKMRFKAGSHIAARFELNKCFILAFLVLLFL
jgi:hypothetical protein